MGRTAVTVIDDIRTRLSATCLKLLAVLVGLWIAHGGPACRSSSGRHVNGCGHRQNRVRYSLRELARLVCGTAGGSQLRQVRRALSEAAGNTTEIMVVDSARRYNWRKSHILSVVEGGLLPSERGEQRASQAAPAPPSQRAAATSVECWIVASSVEPSKTELAPTSTATAR